MRILYIKDGNVCVEEVKSAYYSKDYNATIIHNMSDNDLYVVGIDEKDSDKLLRDLYIDGMVSFRGYDVVC